MYLVGLGFDVRRAFSTNQAGICRQIVPSIGCIYRNKEYFTITELPGFPDSKASQPTKVDANSVAESTLLLLDLRNGTVLLTLPINATSISLNYVGTALPLTPTKFALEIGVYEGSTLPQPNVGAQWQGNYQLIHLYEQVDPLNQSAGYAIVQLTYIFTAPGDQVLFAATGTAVYALLNMGSVHKSFWNARFIATQKTGDTTWAIRNVTDTVQVAVYDLMKAGELVATVSSLEMYSPNETSVLSLGLITSQSVFTARAGATAGDGDVISVLLSTDRRPLRANVSNGLVFRVGSAVDGKTSNLGVNMTAAATTIIAKPTGTFLASTTIAIEYVRGRAAPTFTAWFGSNDPPSPSTVGYDDTLLYLMTTLPGGVRALVGTCDGVNWIGGLTGAGPGMRDCVVTVDGNGVEATAITTEIANASAGGRAVALKSSFFGLGSRGPNGAFGVNMMVLADNQLRNDNVNRTLPPVGNSIVIPVEQWSGHGFIALGTFNLSSAAPVAPVSEETGAHPGETQASVDSTASLGTSGVVVIVVVAGVVGVLVIGAVGALIVVKVLRGGGAERAKGTHDAHDGGL
jgi:hypothetical protein